MVLIFFSSREEISKLWTLIKLQRFHFFRGLHISKDRDFKTPSYWIVKKSIETFTTYFSFLSFRGLTRITCKLLITKIFFLPWRNIFLPFSIPGVVFVSLSIWNHECTFKQSSKDQNNILLMFHVIILFFDISYRLMKLQ